MNEISKYLEATGFGKSATMSELQKVQEYWEISLPEQYIDFMLITNGYTGSIGESYTDLWKVENLIEYNEGYAVKEFAPNLIIFGSDGGGEAYAFDIINDMCIVKTPFIGMGDDVDIIANTFNSFIEKLFIGLL